MGAVGGTLIIAGGETTAGSPTRDVWGFSPSMHVTEPLPRLPVATDHAAGAVLDGALYVISGLRDGLPNHHIVAFAPRLGRWANAGVLHTPLSNPAAAPLDGGIAVVGGKTAAGATDQIMLLRALP
jgi:N-acetylneuraminic acid mutarotase